MKKRSDRDLFGITLALFDRRSEAFRQKMLNHFQSNGRQLWKDIEIVPDRKKRLDYILEGKRLTGRGGHGPTTATLPPE